jgi:nucleoside-diphosphate kinase
MKFCAPSREHLSAHYADLSTKKFFPGLIDYMASGPVIAMVWEGFNAVACGRKMLGATKPQDSEPGTIRGDYCIDVGRCADISVLTARVWHRQAVCSE